MRDHDTEPSVAASFEGPDVAQTGQFATPGSTEASLGGHAVVLVGWDESPFPWIVRNSWGPTWGDSGHFHAWPGFVDLISEAWTAKAQ
jgi:C1A family cysteine protease